MAKQTERLTLPHKVTISMEDGVITDFTVLEYIETTADDFAQFLMSRFGVPFDKDAGEGA